MKSYLKNGLIGLVIGALLSIIVFVFNFGANFIISLALPILFVVQLISGCSGEGCIILVYAIVPALLIEGFAVGILVGYLKKKVKE